MKYPLHTTGEVSQLRLLLGEPGRRAVWVHVFSDAERAQVLAQIERAEGWYVVGEGELPCFFVVAVRNGVTMYESQRLINLIKPRQTREEIQFLGVLFGYAPHDIEWYLEVAHAGRRSSDKSES